ncbi:MAG: ASKHA domain-containing protein [Clostridiales bacterium]|nr:ASKHA domain-containing protein [Clostridiales bacterium]
MNKEKTLKITVLPSGREIAAEPGENLYRVLAARAVPLEADCAGRGLCRRCLVRVEQGRLSPPGEAETAALGERRLREGWALACLRRVEEDVTLAMPEENGVFGYDEEDGEAAPQQEAMSSKQSMARRSGEVSARDAYTSGQAENVTPFDIGGPLGLAVDLGTTTLAAALADLTDGRLLAKAGKENSQRTFGADVVSRLSFAAQGREQAAVLQKAAVRDVEELACRLCAACGTEPEQIKKVVLAGNSAMSGFFWGADCSGLMRAPFREPFLAAPRQTGRALGFVRLGGADMESPPNIGGFVGSDAWAAALSAGLLAPQNDGKARLLLDIGTNGEIILSAGGRLWTASAAAGPAFEGVHITHGMRAAAGAIDKVWPEGETLRARVIGGSSPLGLCGSGLLSLAAALLRAGILQKDGRFAPAPAGKLGERLRRGARGREFVLLFQGEEGAAQEIALTQDDVRQLQLAKGALAAAAGLLLEKAGLTPDDVEQVFLTGAFGARLETEDALTVGLLPRQWRDIISPANDAALKGAYLYLLGERGETPAIEHVDLASCPGFQEKFIASLSF